MLQNMMCWLGVLCCILLDLYWTCEKGFVLNYLILGGNEEMGVKLNSLSNILHKVLD
jgi:hypothetical protein